MAAIMACGGSDEPPTEAGARLGPASDHAATTASARLDPLVLVANVNEAPLHLLPRDWADLFHFRFANELLMPTPESSTEVGAFMEGVIRAETLRTGTVDAGFDWLRRLDNVVLAYEGEADDVRWRMRQGDAWFALLPSSEVGPLLEREGFQVVELESGMDPASWASATEPAPGSAPESPSGSGAESSRDAAAGAPEIPGDWYARWSAEVRGRG